MSFFIKVRYLFVMLSRTFFEWRGHYWKANLNAFWCCSGKEEVFPCGCGGVTYKEFMTGKQ
jgi:hypothetical protein